MPVAVARDFLLETTALIDLEREANARGSVAGPMARFLEEHEDDGMHISFITLGEFACGFQPSQRESWEVWIRPLHVLELSDEIAWEYGQNYRYLKKQGLLIGANDLWIAATALVHEVPVVTRNTKPFERVPDLEVLSY